VYLVSPAFLARRVQSLCYVACIRA
jgi:hypothetical protein